MYLTVPTAPLVRPASIQRFLVNSTLQPLARVMSGKRPPASLALALLAPFPLFQLLQGAIGFPSALQTSTDLLLISANSSLVVKSIQVCLH